MLEGRASNFVSRSCGLRPKAAFGSLKVGPTRAVQVGHALSAKGAFSTDVPFRTTLYALPFGGLQYMKEDTRCHLSFFGDGSPFLLVPSAFCHRPKALRSTEKDIPLTFGRPVAS